MKIYVFLSGDNKSIIKQHPTTGKASESFIKNFIKKVQQQKFTLSSEVLEQISPIANDSWANLLGFIIEYMEDHDIYLMTDKMVEKAIISNHGGKPLRSSIHPVPKSVPGSIDIDDLDGYYYRIGYDDNGIFTIAIQLVPITKNYYREDVYSGILASLSSIITNINDKCDEVILGMGEYEVTAQSNGIVDNYWVIKLGIGLNYGDTIYDQNVLSSIWAKYLYAVYLWPLISKIPFSSLKTHMETFNDPNASDFPHFSLINVYFSRVGARQSNSLLHNIAIKIAGRMYDKFANETPESEVKDFILSDEGIQEELKLYSKQVQDDIQDFYGSLDDGLNLLHDIVKGFPQSKIENGINLKIYYNGLNYIEIPTSGIKENLKKLFTRNEVYIRFLNLLTDDYIRNGDFVSDLRNIMMEPTKMPVRLGSVFSKSMGYHHGISKMQLCGILDLIQEMVNFRWFIFEYIHICIA